MPAKSQQQLKLIYAKRNQYGSKAKAPKEWKWVFDKDWTDNVKMKKLPKKAEEQIVRSYIREILKENWNTDDVKYLAKFHSDASKNSAKRIIAQVSDKDKKKVEKGWYRKKYGLDTSSGSTWDFWRHHGFSDRDAQIMYFVKKGIIKLK